MDSSCGTQTLPRPDKLYQDLNHIQDPSVRVRGGNTDPGSKVVVDATSSIDAGDFSIPGRAFMEESLKTWKAAGLPEFDIPKRLDMRLDRG